MEVVTTAGYQITRDLDGRRYTLRAPTYGEYTSVILLGVRNLRPVSAVVNFAIREALAAAGKDGAADSVAEYEGAMAAYHAVLGSHPVTDDPEGARERRQAMREALDRLHTAEAQFRAAEWAAREDPEVLRLRGLSYQLDQDERLATLAICLVSCEGEGAPAIPQRATADWISQNLPVGDVARLGEIAQELVAPTKVAEKNSPTP